MTVYTTDHSPQVLQTHDWRTAANSAAYLLPHIKPNSKILDIGCGPGTITTDLARLAPTGHVTGLEYVPDPLPQARSHAEQNGVTNVDFQVGDIHSLNFPDNSFDIVHVHQVLQHVADPVHALQEMRRVAKADGGIVAARESAVLSWYPENAGIEKWLDLSARVGKAKGGNPHPGRVLHVWAREAGFEDLRIRRSAGTWCFSSPEERRYWGGSMAGRVRDSGFAKLVTGEGFAGREVLEEIAEGWEEFVRAEDGWFGLMHGEILCWK